jgi:hypothetical protein
MSSDKAVCPKYNDNDEGVFQVTQLKQEGINDHGGARSCGGRDSGR